MKKQTALRELFEEASVTLERLCADAGVPLSSMHIYLRGSQPRANTAVRICSALSALLGREVTVSDAFVEKK